MDINMQNLVNMPCGQGFQLGAKHTLNALKLTPIRDPTKLYKHRINGSINMYVNEEVIRGSLIFTPLFINVTLKPCPPGFSDEILGCD